MIADYCKGKIGISFGVGTNFTNDVGLTPLNIVVKMTDALPDDAIWTPVVKLSDERVAFPMLRRTNFSTRRRGPSVRAAP